MNAIRKIVKREGNSLNIVLPDDFIANEMELIILPYENGNKKDTGSDNAVFREKLRSIFGNFNFDLTGYKFNRDELYDR